MLADPVADVGAIRRYDGNAAGFNEVLRQMRQQVGLAHAGRPDRAGPIEHAGKVAQDAGDDLPERQLARWTIDAEPRHIAIIARMQRQAAERLARSKAQGIPIVRRLGDMGHEALKNALDRNPGDIPIFKGRHPDIETHAPDLIPAI